MTPQVTVVVMIPAMRTPSAMAGRAVRSRRSSTSATRAPVQAPVPGRGTATSRRRPGRRYLRKGGDERTHQIHVFAQSDTGAIQRHLAVRDYLRAHPEKARQYGVLKQALAEKFPYDIDGYCDGKEAFMKELEGAALDWAKGTQWQGFPAALPKERENR